jgi:hypothetical protein
MREPFGEFLPGSILCDDEPQWRADIDRQNANHIREVTAPSRYGVLNQAASERAKMVYPIIVAGGTKNGKWEVEDRVKTPARARIMGLDTNRIYLPTANLEPNGSGRPRPKPGTFMIVEVGRM